MTRQCDFAKAIESSFYLITVAHNFAFRIDSNLKLEYVVFASKCDSHIVYVSSTLGGKVDFRGVKLILMFK